MKYLLIGSLALLIFSIIGLFNMDKFYSPILFFIALNFFLLGFVWIHLKRTNSNRLIGIYLIGAILIYNLIEYEPTPGIEYIFFNVNSWQDILQALLTLTLLAFGIYYLTKGGNRVISVRRTDLKICIVLFLGFLMTEIPVYNIHEDIGGNLHGHGLTNGIHLH